MSAARAAAAPAADGGSDGLPQPLRSLAAITVWLTMLLAVLDSSIANVALPTIARDLGTSAAQSIWVVNAYQIAITMALLPLAALGEIVGYKRVYLTGIALFVGASLSCTVAGGLLGLSVSRFVQGLGAASLMAVSGAIVRLIYPRATLGRGIGYNALVIAAGSAAGPSVAAAVLSVASWRWLFAINLPVGLAAFAIGLRSLPAGEPSGRRYDWPKALLVALGFTGLFLGSSGLAHGTAKLASSLETAAGIAIMILLVGLSWRERAPIVPVDLVRIRILRLSYLTSICSFIAQATAFVTLPFLLQARLGFDQVETGLLLTPWPVATAICAPIAGRLVEHVSPAVLGCVGLAATAAGLALLAMLPASAPIAMIVSGMALAGGGFGIFQTPNNRTMLSNAPPGRGGAAAGMLATSRLVGQSVGALAVAFIFHLRSETSPAPLMLGAAMAAVASMLSLRRIRA